MFFFLDTIKMNNIKKNFTEIEKNLLTSILVEYKDIIENKKTDGASVKTKNEAWDKVTAKFNASHLINQKADTKQLQRLWTNMEQRQRDALTQKRQRRLSTGGGTSIGDAPIDPNISRVSPNLMVEVSGVVDSDSGFVVFDEESLEFFESADSVAESEVSGEGTHKELAIDVNSGLPTMVMRMEAVELKSKSQNQKISRAIISSTLGGTTMQLAPPLQPPPRKLSSLSTLRPETPPSRSPSPVASGNKKDILMQQEAECRMRREKQLMAMEKALWDQRLLSEKENTGKLKAAADLAELDFKIRTRQAEK